MGSTFSEIVVAAGLPELAKCAPTLEHVIAARATIDNIRRKAFLAEEQLTMALRQMDTLIEQMSKVEGE